MELTSDNVEKIFMDCLFQDGEDMSDPAIANGLVRNFGFQKERLKSHEDEISSMLSQLPKEFQQNSGGGMSFLSACNRADGEQWTGLHARMEQLFCLGLALLKVKCLLPRELWPALPGGMPYYVVV